VEKLLSELFWPVVILLGLALGGTLIAYLARRWSKLSDLPSPSGFTLYDLRKLMKEGKMTEEEFKKASALVSKAQSAQLLSPVKPEPKPEIKE